MDNRVVQLESKIRQSILIPESLRNNCTITTTGLGGVFIVYCSNSSSRLDMDNSQVQLRISFDTTDGFGRYIGEEIGVEVTRAWGIKAMQGIKKKRHWQEVVAKVNKYLNDNEAYLYSCIVNKI